MMRSTHTARAPHGGGGGTLRPPRRVVAHVEPLTAEQEAEVEARLAALALAAPPAEPLPPPPPAESDPVVMHSSVQFSRLAYTLLTQAMALWPDDVTLKAAHDAFIDGIVDGDEAVATIRFQAELVRRFVREYSGAFSLVHAEDEGAFAHPTPFLTELHAAAKFAALPDTVRTAMWTTITQMVTTASVIRLYDLAPRGMVTTLYDVTSGLMGRMRSGALTMQNFDINELAGEIMEKLGDEDMRVFQRSVLASGGVDSFFSLVKAVLPSGGMSAADAAAAAASATGMAVGPAAAAAVVPPQDA